MKLMGVSNQGDVQKRLHINERGNVVIERLQDLDKSKEYVRMMRDGNASMAGMKHIAFIPDVVIDLLKKEGLDVYNKDDMPKIIAKLNTYEYSEFRTVEKI